MRGAGRAVTLLCARLFCFFASITIAVAIKYGVPIEINNWETGRSPLKHMVDVTNEFGLKVLAEHNFLNENNIALSPYGLMGIMIALYEGVDGDSSYQIQRALQLPWNRNVMRVGFRDIHRALKTYFVPEEGFLTGLALSSDNVTFQDKYIDILRFYGFDIEYGQMTTTTTPNANVTSTPTTTDVNETTTTPSCTETTTNPSETSTTGPTTMSTPTTPTTTTVHTTTSPTTLVTSTTEKSTTNATSSDMTTTNPTTMTGQMNGSSSTTTVSTTVTTPESMSSGTTYTTTTGASMTTSEAATPSTSTEATSSSASTANNQNTPESGTTTTVTPSTSASTQNTQNAITESSTTSTETPSSGSITTTASGNVTPSSEATPTSASFTLNLPTTENVKPSLDNTLPSVNQLNLPHVSLQGDLKSISKTMSFGLALGHTQHALNPTSINGSMLETLERRKKSIVDYLFRNPHAYNYPLYRSFDIGPQFSDMTYGGDEQEMYFPDDAKKIPPYVGHDGTQMFLANGIKNVEVTYMSYDATLEYAHLPHLDASALRLPLDSDRYYLLLVLPAKRRAGELARLLARMARSSDLSDVYNALRPKRVRALVPSFFVKGHIALTTDLQRMGIREVFQPRQNDFTPMTSQAGVYVRSIEQAVSVAIRKYSPDETKKLGHAANRQRGYFAATHPFLYFIMDANINVALMAGKLVDPLNSRIL